MPPALFEFNLRSEPVTYSSLQQFRLLQCCQTIFCDSWNIFPLFLLAPCSLGTRFGRHSTKTCGVPAPNSSTSKPINQALLWRGKKSHKIYQMSKFMIVPNVRSGNETKVFTFLDQSLNLQTSLPKSSCSCAKICQMKETTTDSFFSCTHENTLVNNLHMLPLHVKTFCCYNYNLKVNKL